MRVCVSVHHTLPHCPAAGAPCTQARLCLLQRCGDLKIPGSLGAGSGEFRVGLCMHGQHQSFELSLRPEKGQPLCRAEVERVTASPGVC